MLEEGQPAPSFELPDQDNQPVSLEDFAGQWLVVYFYPRAGTEGCTSEALGFADRHAEFQQLGGEILGVSDDPPADNARFRSAESLPFRLLSDEDGSMARTYDAYGEKQMFGNTFDGIFRHSYLIDPDGHIERAYKNVDPESHPQEVLEDLKDLQEA